jgi:hypothetical protein
MAASKSRSRKSFDGPTAEEKIVASLIELMEAGSAPLAAALGWHLRRPPR